MFLQEQTKYEIISNGVNTGVFISAHAYNHVLGTNEAVSAIRALTRDAFPEDTLATHSALGRRSRYPGLDAQKLEAIKSKYCSFTDINVASCSILN